MPDQAISKIADPDTRTAIMLLRTEIFRHLDQANEANEKTARLLSELTINVRDENAGRQQWQQSAARIQIEDRQNNIEWQRTHDTKDDRRFEEAKTDTDRQFTTMKNWLIGVLCTMLGSSWIAIGVMFWARTK